MFDRSLCEIEMPSRAVIPECGFHDGAGAGQRPKAEYDGRTKYDRTFAFMCAPCFELVGLGLGPDLGARFVIVDDER